jgi:phosphopantothenoylcysteine decarboxylase/phosphopantothenate--cysteine ligase
MLKDKTVILGVTGSIAAYKGVDLASRLTQDGALVLTVMTESATKFVAPLAFESITGQAVYADLWQQAGINHITLAEQADIVLIAPATANNDCQDSLWSGR